MQNSFDPSIADAFDLQPVKVIPNAGRLFMMNYTIVNKTGEKFFIKCCPKDMEIKHLDFQKSIHDYLQRKDIPVPTMLCTVSGNSGVTLNGITYACFSHIRNNNVCFPSACVKDAGALLGRIHRILEDAPFQGEQWNYSLQNVESIKNNLKYFIEKLPLKPNNDIDFLIIEKLPIVNKVLDNLESLVSQLTPIQVIHGDYNQNNVLTYDGKITGCIDFANATFGHPIEDLAEAALMYFGSEEINGHWRLDRNFAKQFLQGYFSENKLSTYMIEILPDVLKAQCVRHLSYFARRYNLLIRLPEVKRILTRLLQLIGFCEKTRNPWYQLEKELS